MMNDAELLRDYAENRSETAFAGFVERRVGFVYATALRMVAGNAHTAQDVTQAVFVLAASKAAALAKHERLAGWLHTATCNVSRQTLRETRRRDAREQEAARMSEIENGNHGVNHDGGAGLAPRIPDAPDGDTLRPLLDEALGALREGEREAVLLRYFEGMAFAGIGVKFKMSEEAARKRVARAVEKMRALLTKRGVRSSAAALGALMTAEAAQAAPAGLAASVSAVVMASGITAAAGATVTTSTITNMILTFLSSTKATAVAVVAILVAAGGAYYGAQNQHAAANALAQARRENAGFTAQLRALEKQNTENTRDPVAAGRALLADHPELNEKILAVEKSIAARIFFMQMHGMQLPPEQTERIAEILGQGTFFLTTRVEGYGTVTLPPVPPAERRGSSSSKMRNLRDYLGRDGYQKWMELGMAFSGGSNFTKELSRALYFTDEPLTSRQARELEIIARDSGINRGAPGEQTRWDAFIEKSGTILSQKQLGALMAVADRSAWLRAQHEWIRAYDKTSTQSK